MRRNQKGSAATALSNSAALAPQDAGRTARRGGPVGQPAWVPEDVDFHKVPEAVRRAVAEVIEPAYRQLVTEAEDPLERSVGVTMVHLMWLEILEQHEAKHEYLKTSILNLPQDRYDMIDQHLRTLHTKVKVGYFLTRLREMRRRSETPAEAQPAIEVAPPARPRVQTTRTDRNVDGSGGAAEG